MTPLRQMGEAQSQGDIKRFEYLVRLYPEHLYNDHDWERWMATSAREGQLDFVQLLVSLGVGVNAPSGSCPDDTALDGAAHEGHVEVARWLLDRGATVNFTVAGEVRCAALTGAVVGGHLDMVRLLVERGADVNATGGHTTPLGYALGFNQPEVAAYLRSVGGKLPDELG